MKKEEYYTVKNIIKNNADYNIIYGERSNGKTTSVLEYAIEDYIKSNYNNQLGIIRRWDTDLKGDKGKDVFKTVLKLDWIRIKTRGEYNSIFYQSQKWYFCFYDENGEKSKIMKEPFAYGFSLTSEEHYKSLSYPNIKTILFDEFITRNYYLPQEFVTFQNMLSTIIRLRTDVKIFMCGNTVNRYCPYFAEMGLTGVKNQKIGTIDIYRYGESDLKVAVEYSDFPSKKKNSNKYFAFNNPKLEMIRNGAWEIDIYPHLPHKYLPKDVIYYFYIVFDNEMLQGNVIFIKNNYFIYFHRKTTPIKEDNKQLVYQQENDFRNNYRVNILKPYKKADSIIRDLIVRKKVFYQDNEVGDLFNNYIKWCKIN